MSPEWTVWAEVDEHVPDVAPVLVVFVEDAGEDGWLVDVKGDPLFTEDPPFGFCSQKEKDT